MSIYYKTYINNLGQYTSCDFLTEEEAKKLPSSKHYVITKDPIFFSEAQCENIVTHLILTYNLDTFQNVKSFLRCRRPSMYPIITNSSICSALNNQLEIESLIFEDKEKQTIKYKTIHHKKK